MSKVYVLRHAKAEQAGPTDHEWHLNEKGSLQAAALGTWIAEERIEFDVVIVSSSTRTQETLEGLGLETGAVEVSKKAYNSSAETLTQLIRESGATDSVLIIAHNPGVTELCNQAGHEATLSTCTLVELECPGEISNFEAQNCQVSRVVRPEVEV